MDTTLYDGVRTLAAGSPYAVERTEQGFDVSVDLADARWYGLIDKQRLRQTLTHHVSVDAENRTFKILDEVRGVEWQAGAHGRRPVLSGSGSRFVGRYIGFGRRRVWAWDEKGKYGKVLDYTLNTEESRALIRTAARAAGYEERTPGTVRFAMVMGAVGASSIVIVPVAFLVAFLLGKF